VPSWLLYTLGVLIFGFGLLASIALHEVGHMVPAKKFGVKVTQYMVGFGPTLWSRHKGDTEYGVKAIPLGGYIRMIGMVPPRADGKVSRWPRRMASAVEEFRTHSRAEVQTGDEDRQFYRLTPGKKMIVMLGGPTMNLVIFVVLFTILLLTLGKPQSHETTQIATVEKKVVCADPTRAQRDLCPSTPITAPAFGKLQPGDKILSVDGTQVASWDQLVSMVEPAAGRQLTLLVQRDGRDVTVRVTPVENVKYANANGTATKVAGFLGISARTTTQFAPLSITAIPGAIGDDIKIGLDALGKYPEKIHSLWQTVFEGKPRDVNGAIGVVGIGRISGDFASSRQLDVQEKVYLLINLLASVNLLLFFFNLLPLLPLDGGHVAGAVAEATKRGWARLREPRQPAVIGADGQQVKQPRRAIFVDTASMLPVMYAVASVLILLTLLTLYADIVKPINVGG
jgi:membrane-associated protease RseP (regulator of RpoE activity)